MTAPIWLMSSALPCGRPSLMSVRTTSTWSRSASTCAHVAPTLPAPTTVTFRRSLTSTSQLLDDRVGDLARPDGGRVVARRLHVVGDALALADHVRDRALEPFGGLALLEGPQHQHSR